MEEIGLYLSDSKTPQVTMSNRDKEPTEYWVEQLSRVQLPVLSGVMRELNAVTQADDSCATQLSEIILKDSALTAKVLRIANSVYHNPNVDNPINTISRAVVQLGFQGIKAISLSVMMVDSLLKQDARERMLEWMARGFNTGVQAENLIHSAGGSERQEEVFITSLLLHVGEMAFWSCKNRDVEKLDAQLDAHSSGDSELEQNILGTSMLAISQALAEEWNLGEHVREALNPGAHPSTATRAVLLGEEISLAAEKGWDSQEFRDVLVKASMFTGKSLEDVRKMIEQGVEKAASVAVTYGANKVCNYIPSTGAAVAAREKKNEPRVLKADPQLQLDILRDMGAMVEQMVDINTLFRTVVEGVHRGIGLERVALCLIDPKVTMMTAKYVLGEATDEWRTDLQFPVKSDQDNLFAYCLHSRRNLWIQPGKTNALQYLVNKKTERLVTVDNLLVSSIYAGSRPIGVLLADRGKRRTPITQEQHESFDHFSQQTCMSLAMLAAKRQQAAGR